ERAGVPRDPEKALRAGEAGLWRQDDADAGAVEAVPADAGAGDAGDARQLPRAEREALHRHAAADAGPDARHVLGVSVSDVRHAAARHARRRTEAVRRTGTAQAPHVGFVSLGCPKALVDSE